MMTVLVCGGRKFQDRNLVYLKLDKLALEHFDEGGGVKDDVGNWMPLPGFKIVTGACKTGVDHFADDWAVCNWVEHDRYPAEWMKYGDAAGPIRNQKMLVEAKPDLVMAFPGGAGTRNMVRIAKEAGVRVIEVSADGKETET